MLPSRDREGVVADSFSWLLARPYFHGSLVSRRLMNNCATKRRTYPSVPSILEPVIELIKGDNMAIHSGLAAALVAGAGFLMMAETTQAPPVAKRMEHREV